MNEKAIQDSYNIFKSQGYTKSIEEYKTLLRSNGNALNDSYKLFKSNGYSKSIDDYKTLMGVGGQPVKKKEVTPIQKKKDSTFSLVTKMVDASLDTSKPKTAQKPSVSSGGKAKQQVFTGYPGKGDKKYILDESTGTQIWKETVGKGDLVNGKAEFKLKEVAITDPNRVLALNKQFNKKASTGSNDKIFSGFPGNEDKKYILDSSTGIPVWNEYVDNKKKQITNPSRINSLNKQFNQEASLNKLYQEFDNFDDSPEKKNNRYRIKDESWERLVPGSKEYSVVTNEGSITALNNRYNKNIVIPKNIKVAPKELDPFLKINSKILSQTEETAEKFLTDNYKKMGFKFEQTGYGTDYITVTPDNGAEPMTFSFDEKSSSEAVRLQSYLRNNASTENESNLSYANKIKKNISSDDRNGQEQKSPLNIESAIKNNDYYDTQDYKNNFKELTYQQKKEEIKRRQLENVSESSYIESGWASEGYIKKYNEKAKTLKKFESKLYNSEEYKLFNSEKKEFENQQQKKYDKLYDELNISTQNKDKQGIKIAKLKIESGYSKDIIGDNLTHLTNSQYDVKNEIKNLQKRIENLNAKSGSISQEEYNNEIENINSEKERLKVSSKNISNNQQKLNELTGIYVAEKAKNGGFFGNFVNAFVVGLDEVRDPLSFIVPAFSRDITGEEEKLQAREAKIITPEQKQYYKDKGYTEEQIKNVRINQEKLKAITENKKAVISAIGSDLTTEESKANLGFVQNALVGVAASLPSMLTRAIPIIGNAVAFGSMANMSYNAINEEMLIDPDFETTSELDRAAVAVPYSIVMGALENYGLSKMSKGKTGILGKYILNNVLKTIPKGATKEVFENIANKEIKNVFAKGAIKIVGGALAESETGALQTLIADIGIKGIYNVAIEKYSSDEELKRLTGGEAFDTPDTFLEAASAVTEGALSEAIGGFAMSTVMVGTQGLINGNISLYNEEDLKFFEDFTSDQEFKKVIVSQLKTQILNGTMTQKEAENTLNNISSVEGIFNSISDNISQSQKLKAFNLINEKQRIEKEIAGKDENLVAAQKARVAEINNELTKISEDATKESNVQEVTTEGGTSEYQGTGEGQQEVGVSEGSQRKTTQPGTDRGDSVVAGEVQQEEVATLRAEEQAELADAIPNIEDYKVDGEVDKTLMTPEDLVKYNEVYDKYDKLIIPLLPATKVVIDKPTITTNATTEVDRVKSLTDDVEDGATLNLDGSKYEGVGLVVPVDSINTTREELTPEMIADFVEERQDMIGDAGVVKAGVYKFPNSNQVSIDLNVVVPETSRELAIEFGRLADQESLFDLGTGENVKTGGTGKNPMKFTPEQHREIATALKEGRMPNVFGPTVEQEVEAIGQLLSGTDAQIDQKATKIVNKKLSKAVARAAKAVSKIIPGTKFIVHDTDESYRAATKEEGLKQSSNGEFNAKTNTIHINGTSANNRTVAHEIFHAILINKVKTNKNAADVTKRMIESIWLKVDVDINKKLNDFISNYDENIQNEEKLAELVGILADNYNSFSTSVKDTIFRWIDKLAKIFKLDPFDRNETYDMLKTIARKVAKGKVISKADVKEFKGGNNVDFPSEGLTTRKQYGNKKVKVEVRYLEADRINELIKDGLVKETNDLSDLNGKQIVTTSPDDMLVGSIYVNGDEVATGNGGVHFVTKFGDVWANSNEGTTQGIAKAINESSKANNGIAYLGLVKGSDAKLISSPQGVTSSLAITEAMLDAGLFSLSDFRAAIRLAVKDAGGNISLSQNGSAKTLKNELDLFFSDVTASTFEKRGNVLRSIIANLAKSESTKENKKDIIKFLNGDITKGLGVGVTVNSQSLVDLIAKVSAEELTKGLNVGDIYAVIEIKGEVKVFKDAHQSYPFHIKIVNENGEASSVKPILILPKSRKNGKEILTSIDGKTFEDLGSSFAGKVGATSNLPYGKGIIQDITPSDSQSLAVENMVRKQLPVAGNKLFNAPLPQATVIANRYAKSIGIKLEDVNVVNSLNEYKSKAISNEFEKMKDDPTDPNVSAAYKKMAEETIAQYKEIIKDGYFVEINNEEPYSSSEDMISDLNKNKRFKVFSTESGFGDTPITEEQRKVNPLLKDSGFKDVNGIPLLVNDVFRFVHDFFGHAKIGNSFGPIGEENAWKIHSVMYSPLARRAMTSETRGQNSFVNFSGINEEAFKLRDKARELRKNGEIEKANELVGKVYDMMKFADQKIGLMPDWVSEIDPENKEQLDLEAKAIEETISPRKQKPKTINDIVKLTKDQGFSDAAIRQYLKDQGYTDKQATTAINEYNVKKEGIFVKRDGGVPTRIADSIKSFKRRMFSARAFLPKSVFTAREDKEANVARHLNIVDQNVKDFNRLYSKYKGDKDALVDNFDKYIRGDKDAVLPDEFLVVANSMRNQIDGLSQQLINSGIVDADMAKTIKDNMGQYLTRSYKIYDRANWKKEVQDEVKQKAISLLKSQYRDMAQQISDAEGIPLDEALDNLVTNRLDEMLTTDGASNFITGSKLGAKDLSVFKERQDIPIEIRMLLGEYSDPALNYAKTVLKLSSLAANHKFLTEIKKNGTGVYFYEKNDPRRPADFNTMIATEGSDTMNPLNGLYTTKEIADSFMAQPSQLSDFWKTFMKFQSSIRWLKTIGSVATHIKNVFGNLGFVWINGHFDPKEVGRAFMTVKNDFSKGTNQQRRDKMNNYISLGIVKQSAGLGEIMDMFKDANWDTAMASRLSNEKIGLIGKAKRLFFQGKKKIEDAYQAEDDFFKIVAYENELTRYSKAMFNKEKSELTEDELVEVNKVVTEIVKNTYPTYDRIPEAIKMVRRAPFIGNFVSFQAESYRTAFNTVALAKNELTSDNKKIKAIGAQRLAGATTYLSAKSAILAYFSMAAGTGLTGLAGYLFDDDDEEKKDKDIRKFVAPWSEKSDLLMISVGGGKMKYIDFSSSDPHGALKKVMNAFFLGETTIDAFSSGIVETFSPFIGEDMTVEALLALKNNQDKYGNPIYNSEESLKDQSDKVLAYMYKLVEPGTFSSIRRGIASEDKTNELVANLTGFRTYDVDVNQQFGYKIKDYSDRITNAKKIYNSAYYNEKMTDTEKNKAYNKSNESLKKIYLEVTELYDSAERLGCKPEDLGITMKDFGGMSKENITEIQSGKIPQLKKKDEEDKVVRYY